MIDTVVFPVAGKGTRMMPATRSVPKELLPVYDTPLIEFAIDEALAAGARRLVFITHESKEMLATDIERILKKSGLDVQARFVEQDEQLGLGHAVLQAEHEVTGAAFGVILPDDLLPRKTCLSEMFRAASEVDFGSVIAAMEVSREDTSKYGIFETDGSAGKIIPVQQLVEKPSPEDAPSQMAAIGRYVLAREIFDVLKATRPGKGNEIQLTDAIDQLGGIFAFPVGEDRFDCGSKDGLLAASEFVRGMRKSPFGAHEQADLSEKETALKAAS